MAKKTKTTKNSAEKAKASVVKKTKVIEPILKPVVKPVVEPVVEQQKQTVYVVKERHALICKKGVVGPGETVKAKDMFHGEEGLRFHSGDNGALKKVEV